MTEQDVDAHHRTQAELEALRAEIDAVDRQLVSLLAQRAHLAQTAARMKLDRGQPVYDAEREQVILEQRAAWAEEAALPSASMREIFAAILRLSRAVQSGRDEE